MSGYIEMCALVTEEINTALNLVDAQEVEEMVAMIGAAEKVFTIGVGRVLLMLQAFTKRLNHLGIDAYCVGDINEPAITERDLLIVGSGSGESAIPVTIARIAKRYGAKIIQIGSNPQSSVGELADLCVRIPCRTKLNLAGEIPSQQPMSSLFEQSLLLLGDIVAGMIIRKKGLDLKSLWQKHANLE